MLYLEEDRGRFVLTSHRETKVLKQYRKFEREIGHMHHRKFQYRKKDQKNRCNDQTSQRRFVALQDQNVRQHLKGYLNGL